MTTRTAAESRADYEQVMGVELGGIYAELVQELCSIYLVWGQYRILFGTTEARVDLLNQASGSFFRIVQDSLFDRVLLSISRMTDRPSIGPHQTLTVQRIAGLIPDAAFADTVRAKVGLALKAEEFCRDWRNNRIGHNNLEHRLNPSAKPLKDATRLKVDEALAAISNVLNALSSHYLDSETAFEHILPLHPDAEGLLYVIHDGVRAQDERRKKLEVGDFNIDDYPHGL
ncbi:AbiU2 domain-containing protein [Mesorhizobium sp. 131-2-1]|uniref:AbiU2 domain-containing protein n=1 Tax=Mesorhizobium sp. 131-2-1 TaxID=2744518 RepID=UPI00192751F1|nr:hypothetical protein [Mesorhizobium sp. 131-2-1]BCG91434.1 hypothetical protein MesoLj131a_02980 [Mesorhizobium sp. 131-2-1]